MAAPWCRLRVLCVKNSALGFVSNTTKGQLPTKSCQFAHTRSVTVQAVSLLCRPNIQLQHVRHAGGMFNKYRADKLWESVSSVSNAGRKKGRGRAVGKKKITDLNRGQMLGDGKASMLWPGLNAPVIKNRSVVRHQHVPNPDRAQRLIELREKMSRVSYPSTPTLLRGFSGGYMIGMRYGPPDPIGDYSFEGFDTVLLEMKPVTNMTGTLGRKMHYTAFVVTGNKNGLAGYGLGRGTRVGNAVRIAKNRAAQNLYYVPRFDGHTVHHNMFSQYHQSKLYIHKKEKGYGLKCHRIVTAICEMLGISDLHVKLEGSTTNTKAITKGFLNALVDQETQQSLADRLGYHVVEFRRERDQLPVVVASPSDGLVRDAPYTSEDENTTFDLDRMYLGGRREYQRPKANPFRKRYAYRKGQRTRHLRRNQLELHVQRQAGLF